MKYTARKRTTDIVVSVVAIALGLVLIFPVIYCVLGAFKTPAEFLSPRLLPSSFAYTQNFKDAMHQAPMLRYMLNSLIMATLGTVVRLVFSICAAFALTHYEFRGKNFCFFLILGTMMMPGDTLLITNYVTVSRLGLLNTYLGMCITGFVSASQMFMLRQKFLSVPKDLRYAAMIDGCGPFRILTSIIIPMCKPGIVTVCMISAMAAWNEYPVALVMVTDPTKATLPVGLANLYEIQRYATDWGALFAALVLALIPTVILFIVGQKQLVQGLSVGGVKG